MKIVNNHGPIVLTILDGWGIAPPGPGNAVTLAKIPNFDSYWSSFPHTTLIASGEDVGLPRGEPGNSETGHLNIGAGRIVYQDLPKINVSIADGSFLKNPAFLMAANHVRQNNSSLNLMGLVGPGGVHSSLEHIFALLKFAVDEKINNVYLHLFTDGRDSPPTSSLDYINRVEAELGKFGVGKIASICGRYYAMDRDNRWERIQTAYDALTSGIGEKAHSAKDAVQNSYLKGTTDEFIKPCIIVKENGEPLKLISDNDAVIFFNFRVDRPRELTKTLTLKDFENYQPKRLSFDPYAERYGQKQFLEVKGIQTFNRKKILSNLLFVTMTEYEKGLPVEVAFPPSRIDLTLSRLFSENQKRQFHLAETEKYPHVTSFFDGSAEKPSPYEEWSKVPSPNVATYDLMPEMSAQEVTNQFLMRINTTMYDFALVNFANPDMVGHTGVINAGIKACEVTDKCLGQIVSTTLNLEGTVIVTADHGNVEEMISLDTGKINTEHSKNMVPFILINKSLIGSGTMLPQGILADIAPTILSIAGLTVPGTMSGKKLLT